jgi:hypothetical protein
VGCTVDVMEILTFPSLSGNDYRMTPAGLTVQVHRPREGCVFFRSGSSVNGANCVITYAILKGQN